MAKFTCMKMSMRIKPQSDLDKLMARQPTRKLILGESPRFKNSSYGALKKQRKNGAYFIREAYLLNSISGRAMRVKIMAGKSNESFTFSRDTSQTACRASSHVISSLIPYLPFFAVQVLNLPSYAVVIAVIVATARFLDLSHIPKYRKWLINLFKGTKCVDDKPEEISKPHKTTSADPNPKWTLTVDDLLLEMDAYRIENFVINIGILLTWWILCQLFFFVRRFYSKNLRK